MLVGVLVGRGGRVDIVPARMGTRLTLVPWWGRQGRERCRGLRGYDQDWASVGRGWLRAEAGGVGRRIVVKDMFEGHCSAGGEGKGGVQRWELINRFASVDCWTA